MKVIGAGLGRTGTNSVKIALEQLGFDTCYHMQELTTHASHLPYWQQVFETGTTDWEGLFQGYQSALDYPCALYYQELMTTYPDARVVLTIRDPEDWYESAYKTIYAVSRNRYRVLISLLARFVPAMRDRYYPLMLFVNALVWDGQFEGQFENKDFAISKFIEWNASVQATVPAENLLVFDVKQGWQPLCEFLNVHAPDTPFPRANSREEFKAMIRQNLPLTIFRNRK